ncbi:MAG: PilW family protein [Telluria sp.]
MRRSLSRQAGFTLAELMIAITIGLLIVAGMTTLLVNNSQAQSEIERVNRQIENGRYAMEVISNDLRNAGFMGELDPTKLTTPTRIHDPCSTTMSDIADGLQFAVTGVDNADSSTVSCLSDIKSGTDVIVVRRTETCFADGTDCDAASAGGPFLQVSLCMNSTELESNTPTDWYKLGATTSGMDRHQRDCTTVAGVRRYLTHIYYIATGNDDNTSVPTLKRADIVSDATGNMSVNTVALVEGIENLQLEYGMDTTTPASDGVADVFTSAPSTYSGCGGDAQACAVTNWKNVVSVQVSLLARSADQSPGWTDNKSYVLGAVTVTAPGDHYKRHVFQAMIGLPNPAGRKKS